MIPRKTWEDYEVEMAEREARDEAALAFYKREQPGVFRNWKQFCLGMLLLLIGAIGLAYLVLSTVKFVGQQ